MTNTISQLWNGNLTPIKHLGKDNPEIKQLENLIERNLNKLEDMLDERSAEKFKTYNDCVTEYLSLITEQAFSDGFCIGTKIVAEAFTKGDAFN